MNVTVGLLKVDEVVQAIGSCWASHIVALADRAVASALVLFVEIDPYKRYSLFLVQIPVPLQAPWP